MRDFIELLLPPKFRTWYMFMLLGLVVSQVISAVSFYIGLGGFIPFWAVNSYYSLGEATPLPILFCLLFLWEYSKYRKIK